MKRNTCSASRRSQNRLFLLPSAFANDVEVPVVGASEQVAMLRKHPDKDFGYALVDTFPTGFEAQRNKPAKMIAKYSIGPGTKASKTRATQNLKRSSVVLLVCTGSRTIRMCSGCSIIGWKRKG